MPRLPNKGVTLRAPQTGASVPELPDFSPQLAEVPGAQETNAALQRWWDLVRQRIEFNNGSVDGRFEEFTRTIDGITGSITILQEITSSQEGYLESRYTLKVIAGDVVAGMTIYAGTSPVVDVSEIAFQADVFRINTSSAGNIQIFSATATEVKLGDVLTVDLDDAKVFIGVGTYGNANTAFYIDDDGNLSLGDKLAFDYDLGLLVVAGTIFSSDGVIGGFTLSATTLTAGAGDTAVRISSVSTSGFSVGDITSGPSVRMLSTGLIFGVFCSNDTNQSVAQLYTLDFGSKSGQLRLANSAGTPTIAADGDDGELSIEGDLILDAGSIITFGGDTNLYRDSASVLKTDDSLVVSLQLTVVGSANFTSDLILNDGAQINWSDINLYRASANVLKTDDAFQCASLLASGEIRGATARFGSFTGSADVPVTGSVSITDDGGTTRKLAVIA